MLRSGIIATKIGNSSHYKDDGTITHVTILKIDDCVVSGIKTNEKDGYNAVQLASIDVGKDISKINKPQRKLFTSINSLIKSIYKKSHPRN